MSTKLRVLMVEDSESDAALVVRALQKAGYDVEHERVETAAPLRVALRAREWDVVISDYQLPQLDGPRALALYLESGLDIPFLVVSGTIGEDTAVEMIKAGAHDYLMKDNLTRLVPAIEREMRASLDRRVRRRAEERIAALARFPAEDPDPVLRVTADGRVLYANLAADPLLRLWGCDVGEPAPQTWRDRVSSALTTGERLSADLECDGRTYSVCVAPVPDSEYANLYARDDTALRSSEARFSAVFNASPLSIALARLGDSSIIDVNPAWVQGTGISRKEAIGRTTKDLEVWADASERDRLVRALRAHGAVEGFEVRLRRRSGEVRLLLMSAETIEIGDERCLLTMATDITERKRAEEAVALSEERFRAIFEGVTDGLLVARADSGAFLMANGSMCRMLGYGKAEMLRLRVADIHPPEQRPMVEEEFHRQLSGEQSLATKVPVRRNDGSTFLADINALPVEFDGVRCLLGVFRDMTSFYGMEDQLRQAQKMEAVGQLAGGVAHDFNNILGVILGYCDLMRRSVREHDPLFRGLTQIQAGAERAAALTRQLLAFSRQQPLLPKVMDLNATLAGLHEMLHRLIGEDIELEVAPAPDLGAIKADPTQIEQVIINLVVNARDAMPRGGKLLIETALVRLDEARAAAHVGVRPGSYVMLTITDTGCGMDRETRERLFEPFFTTKEKGKGTGLGLSTVYGIVTQSGGYLEVDTELGRGTTFKVYLPQTDEAVVPPAEAPAAPHRPGGEHVLIVEDEAALREIAVDILESLGYRVTAAANGGEALLQVEEGALRPDLLISDVVMPGLTGTALAERLRRSLPGLKVLLMSGYTSEGVERHGIIAADTPFLQKPFNIESLAEKVRLALCRGEAD